MDALLRRRMMMMAGGGPTPVIEPVFYDYLYFDGTAYIATNYILPATCSIRCAIGMETMKGNQLVFGAYGTNGGYTAIIYGNNTSLTRRQIVPYYDSSSVLATNRYLEFSYQALALFLTPKRFGWGSSNYAITKGSVHPDGALHLGSTGGSSTWSKFTGRFGILRVYGSDAQNVTSDAGFNSYTPIATFRPCTYNGQAGMWYVEGNAFFGNSASSGTLTASNS